MDNLLIKKLLEIESLSKNEFEFLLSKTLNARRVDKKYYNYLYDCKAVRNDELDEKTFIKNLRDVAERKYKVPDELVA